MKPLVVYNSKWLKFVIRWAAGMTLYPFIFFKWTKEEVARSHVARHELEHWYDARDEGPLKFYLKYLFNSFRHGYKRNPAEIDANAQERLPLTETELEWMFTESKVAKVVDLAMVGAFTALVATFAYSFYMWTQGA